jgi:hypothetical protein
MAQVPVQTKLLIEDVPKEHRGWMTRLISPLNQFISSTVAAMTRDLTFEQNIRCQIKEIVFVNNADAFPLVFKCSLAKRPMAVWKANIVDVSADVMPFTGIAIDIPDWSYNQSREVEINQISGLNEDQKYRLTVIVI